MELTSTMSGRASASGVRHLREGELNENLAQCRGEITERSDDDTSLHVHPGVCTVDKHQALL